MNKKIERNYLEIKSINELVVAPRPLENLYLEKVNPPDFQINKFFYKQIGKNHRWIDRLIWTDNNWITYLNLLGVNTFILKHNKNLV